MDKLQAFAAILVALAIYYYVVLPYAVPLIEQNFISAFLVFLLAYTLFISIVVFEYDLMKQSRIILALILMFLVFDLIEFPLMLSKTNAADPIVTKEPAAMISSDIFVFKLLPAAIPYDIRLALVYVVIPAALTLAAMFIAGKKFEQIAKATV